MTPRICDDNPAGIDAGFKVSTNSSWATVIFDADDSESGRGFLLRKDSLVLIGWTSLRILAAARILGV